MKIVGLTGGISSGKSTVSSYLKQLKIPVIDADEVARKVVEPNSQGAIEIRKAFGSAVFEEDGSLNRQKLGALIFSNAENRQKLDELLQPLIKTMILDEIEEYRQKGENMIVLFTILYIVMAFSVQRIRRKKFI